MFVGRLLQFTILRLEFSHLCYHKYKHGFLDAIDPLCTCRTVIENTVYYFLHCPNFSNLRNTFLSEISRTDRSIIDYDEIKIIQTFIYGNLTYSFNNNQLINNNKLILVINNNTVILDASIKYIWETERFDRPIF